MPWEISENSVGLVIARPLPIGVNMKRKFGPYRMKSFLGRHCPYCGVTMNRDRGWNSSQEPSRDHRVPRSRGGSDAPENIIVCCRRCNEEKGSLTAEEYMAVRRGLASRLDHMWNARRSAEMNRSRKP